MPGTSTSMPIPIATRTKSRPTSYEGRRPSRKPKTVDEAKEAKRRKVIHEFYETEKAYVDGLELIYSHFLTPIIESLESPHPLLDRASLTAVFANFIDIWNFHRSFFSSLSTILLSDPPPVNPPPLSPVLLSHFPYLSLYTPFVTSFPDIVSSINNFSNPANPAYNAAFTSFVQTQQLDPKCGRLKLRDWLLTIVQRCPRYLLLLKDLINCTNPEDPEHAQLTAVHVLVSKITLSLNTSLHTHAQTLALLSLQRSTPNLPFQLISPGRTLLKRGPLIQIDQGSQPKEREFLLFSDCFLWLASEENESVWGLGSGWISGSSSRHPSPERPPPTRPMMIRTRSKSEAELPTLRAFLTPPSGETLATRSALAQPTRVRHHPVFSPPKPKRHASTGNGEERWMYKGSIGVIDLDVVVTPTLENGEERRVEVLSPQGSFALYAASEAERDDWANAIRQAKAQLMVSLNVTHPNSTLTSSSSTNHLRRTLQALPFHPADERLNEKGKSPNGPKGERRGHVEHWVPAIWIPDGKTDGCMRCGRTFGWRRRRHHCRLCGRCVCASCSGKTFYITDPNARGLSKAARACNACYEAVFPLLDIPEQDDPMAESTHSSILNSIASLSALLPSPSRAAPTPPQALMAIDTRRQSMDASRLTKEPDESKLVTGDQKERIRLKSSPSRPRSYHQIVEDFERRFDVSAPVVEETDAEAEDRDWQDENGDATPCPSPSNCHTVTNITNEIPKEDTIRRMKRFSMPAVALHTTVVTTRTQGTSGGASTSEGGGGRSKRFSLVLNGRTLRTPSRRSPQTPLSNGEAAGKLNELLDKSQT